MKNNNQRERKDTRSAILMVSRESHGGKRITAEKSGGEIFRELARKNPEFFEILGRRDSGRKRDAIRSQTYLRDYSKCLEEVDRIDSRLSNLNTEIRRLRILHEKVSWMNTRNTEMDFDAALRSRERLLEQSRRKLHAIRRIGIIMIEKMEEFRLFKKVRDGFGLNGVRIAVFSPDDV